MDLSFLIGKQFKYNSPLGISNWTDEIKSVFIIHKVSFTKEPTKLIGYTPEINIIGKKHNNVYLLKECIIMYSV